ncbi:hypothetical protein DIPPA_22373 [Diplonema papillatum]|nr:hypothetical protein DIPPA_22373 [Diplonema papillatum]
MTLLDGSKLPVVVYCALPSSKNLIKDEPIETTAKVIAASVGPSGPNTEYLYNMNAALRDMKSAGAGNKVGDVCDDYCFDLEDRVRALANASSPQ